jgi:hypothetical protein
MDTLQPAYFNNSQGIIRTVLQWVLLPIHFLVKRNTQHKEQRQVLSAPALKLWFTAAPASVPKGRIVVDWVATPLAPVSKSILPPALTI